MVSNVRNISVVYERISILVELHADFDKNKKAIVVFLLFGVVQLSSRGGKLVACQAGVPGLNPG